MNSIQNNVISLTRGDSLLCQVAVLQDEETPYTPATGDVIRFFLKRAIMTPGGRAYIDPEPLVEKVIPNDTLILSLEPADTKKLPFGDYVYDCEITFADGTVDTFINNASFRLLPEVG